MSAAAPASDIRAQYIDCVIGIAASMVEADEHFSISDTQEVSLQECIGWLDRIHSARAQAALKQEAVRRVHKMLLQDKVSDFERPPPITVN